MSLEVIVASASDLPNLEKLGKIDPYVSIEYQGNHTRVCVPHGVAVPRDVTLPHLDGAHDQYFHI